MTARLKSRIEISALIRRVEGMGGTAAVLAKGDGEAGAILLSLVDRGNMYCLLERILDSSEAYRWQRAGPQDIVSKETLNGYMQRRRAADPDLWILELDIAGVERFAAEMTAAG